MTNKKIAGIIEARDIFLQLKPLEFFINELDKTDFEEIQPAIKSVFHCICLLWANSRHFCSSTRLINVLKQLTNMILEKVLIFTFFILVLCA